MSTPCDKCKPELNRYNAPYFVLFLYCQDQVIMGPSGPVALNMVAVNQAMIDYQIDIEERIHFSTQVRNIANMIFAAQADEASKKK